MKKHLLGYVLILGLLISSPLRAFVSPDPEGHVASMDLYSYCNGDPVNGYDPDGRLQTGFNSGLNGNISANAPTSSAFYFGNLIGGGVSGAASGAQNGAGGIVNALSLGNVSGAFGSDPSNSGYTMGRNISYGGMATVAVVGTGGLALEAAGGATSLYVGAVSASMNPWTPIAIGGAVSGYASYQNGGSAEDVVLSTAIGAGLAYTANPFPVTRNGGIPNNWIVKPSDSGGGFKYVDPINSGNSVRIMPGNSASPFPNSQGPNVRYMLNGQYLDSNGNNVPKNSPEAHIPLDQFNFNPDLFK